MCRIFGFRSVLESHMHESLVLADNALGVQSKRHPDGWGIAYYVHNTPHVIKSEKAAREDELFPKVSSIVSSNTVIAHIRKATLGEKTILNTHPFQFGPWVFVHNGHIRDFDKHKKTLLEAIDQDKRKYILGTTDSEVIFYFIMSHVAKTLDIFDPHVKFSEFFNKTQEALKLISEIIGPCVEDEKGTDQNYLTFILSNGKITVANHGGKKMYYSTHKKRCIERDSCSYFNKGCEQVSSTGSAVNHFLVSSEKLLTSNVWIDFKMGQIIGVDQDMKLFIS